MANVRSSWDGEWWFVSGTACRLAVYPRKETGKFEIGEPSGACDYVALLDDFENVDAALDHAVWLADEPRGYGEALR